MKKSVLSPLIFITALCASSPLWAMEAPFSQEDSGDQWVSFAHHNIRSQEDARAALSLLDRLQRGVLFLEPSPHKADVLEMQPLPSPLKICGGQALVLDKGTILPSLKIGKGGTLISGPQGGTIGQNAGTDMLIFSRTAHHTAVLGKPLIVKGQAHIAGTLDLIFPPNGGEILSRGPWVLLEADEVIGRHQGITFPPFYDISVEYTRSQIILVGRALSQNNKPAASSTELEASLLQSLPPSASGAVEPESEASAKPGSPPFSLSSGSAAAAHAEEEVTAGQPMW